MCDQIRKWGTGFVRGRVTVSEADNMGPPGGDIEIQVTGPDTDKLVGIANQVKELIANTPGARDVDTDWRLNQGRHGLGADWRPVIIHYIYTDCYSGHLHYHR